MPNQGTESVGPETGEVKVQNEEIPQQEAPVSVKSVKTEGKAPVDEEAEAPIKAETPAGQADIIEDKSIP